MPLASDRFNPATSGRADPDRYLILGFDTEYERYVNQFKRRLGGILHEHTHSHHFRLTKYLDTLRPYCPRH